MNTNSTIEYRIGLEKQNKRNDQVTELILENCQASQISRLTEECVNLETLSLTNVGLTTSKGLPRSLPRLSKLKKLETSDNRLTGGLNLSNKRPNLRSLNISGNRIKNFEALKPLKEFHDLVSLDLYNCEVSKAEVVMLNSRTKSHRRRIKLALLIATLACLFAAENSPLQSSQRGVAKAWQMQSAADTFYKQQIAESPESMMSDENESQLAETMAAVSAAVGAAPANLQCERVNIGLCSQMHYKLTRMPNFFGDNNQFEADEQAKKYEQLVRSNCSSQLLAYLCGLLTPVCPENDPQQKFEILPCRSYCRQVRTDCQEQIFKMALRSKGSAISAFDCDSLPYEENGGNGTLHGPCDPGRQKHQLQESSAHSTQAGTIQQDRHSQVVSNSYRPYQRELDMNVPPFTDYSPIDKGIIKPARPALPATPTSQDQHHHQQAAQNNNSYGATLQSFGHQLAAALVSYSNLLSVLTLVCLLLVVNAKRLRRIKTYLTRRTSSTRSSSTSSTVSSNDSRRKLANNKTGGGGGAIVPNGVGVLGQAKRKLGCALSPSASSRSLVLVTTDGKRGQLHKHHLIRAGELSPAVAAYGLGEPPSQKLLQAGLDAQRRTLINVNGTLERQQQNHQRYHQLMQQSLQADVAAANRHQYDYIQVERNSTARAPSLDFCSVSSGEQRGFSAANNQQFQRLLSTGANSHEQSVASQVYSNILLSSPSHQVLLLGDGTTPNTTPLADSGTVEQAGAKRSHFMTSLNSPYADPTFAAGATGGGSMSSSRPMMHLMGLGVGESQAAGGDLRHQRSFQRRPSMSSSSSQFRRGGGAATTGTSQQPGGPYAVTSSGASSGSSSAGSTTSSFSPPESSSGNPLLGQQQFGAGRRT